MEQPIRLNAAAPHRRLSASNEPLLPSLGELIGRWEEEQARYLP